MKRLIATAANSKVERFMLEHWFASLRASVDLDGIDVLVVDYGLSGEVREELSAQKVIVFEGVVRGHVVNARFLDLARFLERNEYGRVLLCDSGDLIFQSDISCLLDGSSNCFQAMRDPVVINNQIFGVGDIPRGEHIRLLRKYASTPMVNAGVIVGPPACFVSFARFLEDSTRSLRAYGTDQLLLSSFVDQYGLSELDRMYNWMPLYFTDFTVDHGVVLHDGMPIPIVHNAGWRDGLRAFKRFGYGPDNNEFRERLTKMIRRTYREVS